MSQKRVSEPSSQLLYLEFNSPEVCACTLGRAVRGPKTALRRRLGATTLRSTTNKFRGVNAWCGHHNFSYTRDIIGDSTKQALPTITLRSLAKMTVSPAASKLRELLADQSKIIVCPGVFDGLTARIALEAGFDAMYMVSRPIKEPSKIMI